MRQTLFFFLAITLLCKGTLFARTGSEGGGGGFPFYRTSTKLLLESQSALETLIRVTPQDFFDKKLPIPVDKNELLLIVHSLRKNLFVNYDNARANPQGDFEPLMFDYGVENGEKYIVALGTYFLAFSRTKMSDEDKKEVMRMILHESLHHFGYGEQEAFTYSGYIIMKAHQANLCSGLTNCYTPIDKKFREMINKVWYWANLDVTFEKQIEFQDTIQGRTFLKIDLSQKTKIIEIFLEKNKSWNTFIVDSAHEEDSLFLAENNYAPNRVLVLSPAQLSKVQKTKKNISQIHVIFSRFDNRIKIEKDISSRFVKNDREQEHFLSGFKSFPIIIK